MSGVTLPTAKQTYFPHKNMEWNASLGDSLPSGMLKLWEIKVCMISSSCGTRYDLCILYFSISKLYATFTNTKTANWYSKLIEY